MFTDFDLASTTSVGFLDLSKQFARQVVGERAGRSTLSFLGVRFYTGESTGRTRITTGNTPLRASETAAADIAVASRAASASGNPCF